MKQSLTEAPLYTAGGGEGPGVRCLINSLAPRGKRNEWNYQLPEVYPVVLLEKFSLQPEGETVEGSYLYNVCLCN